MTFARNLGMARRPMPLLMLALLATASALPVEVCAQVVVSDVDYALEEGTGAARSADLVPCPVDEGATGPLSATAVVDGAVGGIVRLGRFRAEVPPRAFQGLVSVTLTLSQGRRVDRSDAICLQVIPPSAV